MAKSKKNPDGTRTVTMNGIKNGRKYAMSHKYQPKPRDQQTCVCGYTQKVREDKSCWQCTNCKIMNVRGLK